MREEQICHSSSQKIGMHHAPRFTKHPTEQRHDFPKLFGKQKKQGRDKPTAWDRQHLLAKNRAKAKGLSAHFILSRRMTFHLKNCSKSIFRSKLKTRIEGKIVKEQPAASD